MMTEERTRVITESAVRYYRAISERSSAKYEEYTHNLLFGENKQLPMRIVARRLKANDAHRTARAEFRRHVFNAEIL